MKTKKSVVLLLAVMLFAATLLGGCGKKQNSDTVRWITASYAILTELNGQDYNVFGGVAVNDATRAAQVESLDYWWGVTDRTTAEETLDWVLTEGHRTSFAEDAAYLGELGLAEFPEEERVSFIQYCFEVEEDEAEYLADIYGMYAEYGESAIDAWDYCRALNLLSFYYVAGYYTPEEALDASLEIAKEFQAKYDSWDELVDSYLRGYEYWAEESSDERRAIYEDLKTRKDNPYAVDYDTVLEKTW